MYSNTTKALAQINGLSQSAVDWVEKVFTDKQREFLEKHFSLDVDIYKKHVRFCLFMESLPKEVNGYHVLCDATLHFGQDWLVRPNNPKCILENTLLNENIEFPCSLVIFDVPYDYFTLARVEVNFPKTWYALSDKE
jgi:hypothetical protein